MIFYVYVLLNSKTKNFYIGYTNNLKRRLKEHEKTNLPHRNQDFKLVFFEAFVNKKDAKKREKYLKSTKGRRALKLMLKYTLES